MPVWHQLIGWLQDPGNLLAALAIWVSLIAWWNSYRIGQIEAARERDRLRERSQAKLSAALVPSASGYALAISNKGNAEARNIDVTLDGQPVMEHPTVGPMAELNSPVGLLGPGSSFRYNLLRTIGEPLPRMIEIKWEDDSNEPGYYRTTLTL